MHLFQVVVTTNVTKTVNVISDTPENAQAKVVLTDGETVVEVRDSGEVIQ